MDLNKYACFFKDFYEQGGFFFNRKGLLNCNKKYQVVVV